jgi:hypothetical protein
VTITGNTGADDILPGVLAAVVAGDNVVQGKLSAFFATVLADILVTVKNLKAGEPSLWSRTLNHAGQADYRGYREDLAYGVDESRSILQHLSLAAIYQDYRAPGTADIERLVVLIQYQHG